MPIDEKIWMAIQYLELGKIQWFIWLWFSSRYFILEFSESLRTQHNGLSKACDACNNTFLFMDLLIDNGSTLILWS